MAGALWSGSITANGPIFPVRIGVSDAQQAILLAAGQQVPEPVPYDAMIDTGASMTVIHQGLLDDAIYGAPIPGGHGFDFIGQQHNVTLRAIKIYFETTALILHVGEWPLNPTEQKPTRVIIGRDILSHGGLLYDGQAGRWKLWYML